MRQFFNFNNEKKLGYLFTVPTIIIISLVMIFPLLYGFIMSFFKNKIVLTQFVGLSNYMELIINPDFWNSVLLSLKYTFGSVVLHFILGMILALLLNHTSFFNSVVRVLILIPWMVANPIVGIIWKWIYEPTFGILNDVLLNIGLINQPIAFLGDLKFALLAAIITNTWRGFPFIGLLLLAGLQAIPETQYEAATVDGANSWQVFRYVTLPNLKHVIIVAVTIDLIWTLRGMDLINVLTSGGPGRATEILPMLIYKEAFQFMNFGSAAAISAVLFLFLLTFLVIYVAFSRSESE